MIKLQKFEVVKMVLSDSISAAYTVSNDNGHKVTFSAKGDVAGLVLVTQKGAIKEFKTLDAVRSFMQSVGIKSFSVCG
tara:strand:- start:1091 stop:1324 length:234 start_codon:yes stop_codon:yes gene_type:complete